MQTVYCPRLRVHGDRSRTTLRKRPVVPALHHFLILRRQQDGVDDVNGAVGSLDVGEAPMEVGQALGSLRERYTATLLSGDQEEAFRVIKDALDRGINPLLIYVDVITPALAEVGNAWHRGDLNIAAEHLAIQITLQQSAYIRGRARRRQRIGAEAAITAVEGGDARGGRAAHRRSLLSGRMGRSVL